MTITLQAGPGVNGMRSLRTLLKTALRRHGLRCTRISSDPFLLEPADERRVADGDVHARKSSCDG
jgi:hypothetical protein